MDRIRQQWAVRVLCLIVFLASLAYGVITGPELKWQDEIEYHQLAEGIGQRLAYEKAPGVNTAFRPPGYPIMLAGVYAVWHSTLAAKIVNAIAIALTALLAARIVGLVSPRGAVLAPVLMLFYPVFLYTSGTLYPQTVGAFLLVASIGCVTLRPGRAAFAALGGALFGLLILMIPSFLMTLPILALTLLIHERRTRRSIRMTVLFCAISLLVVLPWTVRNRLVFHETIVVSSNSGINFLLGNSARTRPNSGVNVDLSEYYARMPKGVPYTEKSADDFYLKFALEWIASEPVAAARLMALKTLNYFNFRNELGTAGRGGGMIDVLLFVTYYPLLALAILRLFQCGRFPLTFTEKLLYVLYFSNAVIAAIFFTRIRFRLPFDAMLVILVSIYLAHWWEWWKARRSR